MNSQEKRGDLKSIKHYNMNSMRIIEISKKNGNESEINTIITVKM